MQLEKITATKNDQGRSLYKLLSKYFDNVPKSKLEQLFRKKDIKVNGKRNLPKDYAVQEGDQIWVYGISDVSKEEEIIKVNHNFTILHEDANILVIDKKEGISIHDGDNCLDNQVLSYLKYKKTDSFKPSHIGRLDKETSGIIVYGKTYEAVVQFNNATNNFTKKYLFISDFNYDKKEVVLYQYIDKETQKLKFSPKERENSKMAHTILTYDGKRKEAEILTGRKHQIRIALKFLGYPIYGDKKYGGKKAKRLMLHSYYLKLNGLEGALKYLNGLEFISHPKW